MKYKELAEWLKYQISSEEYKEGDKLPTENELSNRFDVSRDTVRKAIDMLEKENLLYKVRGSGTYVRGEKNYAFPTSRRLEERKKRIGILMNDVDNYIFPSIVKGINQTMSEYGYATIMQFTNNNIALERGALEEFLKGDFDGVIIEPTRAALPQLNYDVYEQLSKTVPTILIHAKIPTLPLSAITMGDEQGGYLLTEYLLSKGHKNIATLFTLDEQTGTSRYLGHVKALQKAGIPIRNENLFWYDSQDAGAELPFASEERFKAALSMCSAIICQDDRIAKKLQLMLRMNPEFNQDLVVCGFDDSDLAKDNNIISVSHPKELFGQEVAHRLLRKIDNPMEDVSFDFMPKVVVR